MQITPNSSLIRAVSSQQPVTIPTKIKASDAGAAAARAVFAQLKAPQTLTSQPVPAPQPTQQAQPGRPAPRGSIVNILV